MNIDPRAMAQARDFGLSSEHLRQFASRAAIVTHSEGNRRFGGYVMWVEDDTIWSIDLFDKRMDVCDDCHGLGFHQMTEGGLVRMIRCQVCNV